MLPIDASWSLDNCVETNDSINAVNAYKHMGGASTAQTIMKHEIKIRAASMFGVFKSARKSVFANRRVAFKAQSQYTESLFFFSSAL